MYLDVHMYSLIFLSLQAYIQPTYFITDLFKFSDYLTYILSILFIITSWYYILVLFLDIIIMIIVYFISYWK